MKKKNKYKKNPETKLEYEKKIKKMRKILNQNENMRKANIKKILNQKKKENCNKMHKKNKKILNKVEKFCQQIRQDHYFICTVWHP